MKAPGINISGALEELEKTSAELISKAANEKEKGEIEVETVEIRNLILAPASVGGPVSGTGGGGGGGGGGPVSGTGGRRRRRKTRRGKKKALLRYTRTNRHK
jgi:hypothetical protein